MKVSIFKQLASRGLMEADLGDQISVEMAYLSAEQASIENALNAHSRLIDISNKLEAGWVIATHHDINLYRSSMEAALRGIPTHALEDVDCSFEASDDRKVGARVMEAIKKVWEYIKRLLDGVQQRARKMFGLSHRRAIKVKADIDAMSLAASTMVDKPFKRPSINGKGFGIIRGKLAINASQIFSNENALRNATDIIINMAKKVANVDKTNGDFVNVAGMLQKAGVQGNQVLKFLDEAKITLTIDNGNDLEKHFVDAPPSTPEAMKKGEILESLRALASFTKVYGRVEEEIGRITTELSAKLDKEGNNRIPDFVNNLGAEQVRMNNLAMCTHQFIKYQWLLFSVNSCAGAAYLPDVLINLRKNLECYKQVVGK